MRRLVPALLATSCLVAAAPVASAAAAAPAWERNKESISCTDDTGSTPFYNGSSASALYDSTFQLGHDIPQAMRDGYVPQGLGTWPGGGGAGKDLLLQTAYNDDTDRAVVVGMVPGGGSTQMPLLVRPGKDKGYVNAHVGGVAVVGSWMFVAGETVGGLPTVLKFPLERVAKRLADGKDLKAVSAQRFNVGTAGFAASFLAAEGNTLWIGTFDKSNRNRMYQFSVGPKGAIKRIGGAGAWTQVPKKTQGLAVTPTHFIYSTSWTSEARSNVYVVRRGKKYLDKAYPQDLECFAAPSMSEGVALSGGEAFLSFESGSYKYRDDPCDKGIFEGGCTRNIITNLHRAPLATLLGMT